MRMLDDEYCDTMDVPSKCTIVRAIGRTAYGPKTTKESVVGTEVTLSAMLKTHKRKDCISDGRQVVDIQVLPE
jgi:hypothetical protein